MIVKHPAKPDANLVPGGGKMRDPGNEVRPTSPSNPGRTINHVSINRSLVENVYKAFMYNICYPHKVPLVLHGTSLLLAFIFQRVYVFLVILVEPLN